MRNASETLVKSAGDLYLAPLGTGAPDAGDLGDEAALALEGWANVGHIHADGPTFGGFEGTNTKLPAWNQTIPIRSVTRVTEPQIEVPLVQWNTDNLSLYFPGATYDAGSETLTVPQAGNPEEQELLLVVQDGDGAIGIWFGKTTHRGGGAFAFPGDGFAPIPVIFDVLATDDDFIKFVGVTDGSGS